MKKFSAAIKRLYNEFFPIFVIITALILNIIIESLGRRSLLGGLGYIIYNPLMFLLNALIIFATLSFSLILKRRLFFLSLFSLLWLSFGIVNFILLSFRITPLSVIDLQIIGSALTMIGIYLEIRQIILITVLIILAVGGLILLWLKAPKYTGKRANEKNIAIISASLVSVAVINISMIASGTIRTFFPNIADAYNEYGFVYCFTLGMFDKGIDRPDDYSREYMAAMKQELGNLLPESAPDVMPNIIMVQLESFFDVNYFTNMKFSENPVPFFTYLKNNYSGGVLTVPAIGGGTISTEFEVLTGLSLDFFGIVEYPYISELKDTTIESICFDLKDYGYQSYAIHNNDGTFYDRHEVFPNLGFDSFSSVEYMDNITFNVLGWVEDRVLIKEVSDALSLTKERDFVYAMTVQSHGRYPREIPEGAPMSIEVDFLLNNLTEEQKNEFRYYINQIREVDRFILELTEYYADYHEPVIIVFFGDHLPSLRFDESDLTGGDLHDTEYVIWSNYEIPVIRENLEAYRLSAHLFDILGYNGGYINTYNRFFADSGDYPSGLQYLGYYMIHDDTIIHQPAEMRMGIRTIRITDVTEVPNERNSNRYDITIRGENFTSYSVVMLNDRRLTTEFVSADTLIVYNVNGLREGDIIAVAQIGRDNEILSVVYTEGETS